MQFPVVFARMPVPEVWGWKRGEGEECWGGAPGSRQPEAEAESIEWFIEGQAFSRLYAMVPRRRSF